MKTRLEDRRTSHSITVQSLANLAIHGYCTMDVKPQDFFSSKVEGVDRCEVLTCQHVLDLCKAG